MHSELLPLQEEAFVQARILIIDDEDAIARLLERVLTGAGYRNVRTRGNGKEGVALFRDFQPDLVLLDLRMPGMDGFEVLEAFQEHCSPADFPPILVLTGDLTRESSDRALSSGAKDFLTKPVRATETLLRIRNLLETRFLYGQLRSHAEELEQRVRERTSELEEARDEVLDRLALAAEFRDDITGQHAKRVGELAARIALSLGWERPLAELMRRAAPLHDVGKIALRDDVLLKPGPLTAEEFIAGQVHTAAGARILAGSRDSTLRMAEEIAFSHHERWDGSGYPRGYVGEEIPVSARIVAVADVYDALTSERPYKSAWTHDAALLEIRASSGSHFDPDVVEAFLKLFPD